MLLARRYDTMGLRRRGTVPSTFVPRRRRHGRFNRLNEPGFHAIDILYTFPSEGT